MQIFDSDYTTVMEELSNLVKEGATYIAYLNDDVPVRSCGELSTFRKAYDAAEYCFEMSTDIDQYYSVPVVPLYRAMKTALENKVLPHVGDDGTIDLAALLRSYYRNELTSTSINKNNLAMNEKNFEYLKDQVMYTGFGESMEGELRQNMEKLEPSFSLKHDAFYGNDKVTAELNFKKSDQTDLYFFNSYKVQLQKEGAGEKLEQTIYINRGNNITLKEAYNLMEGRAVNKDLTNKEGEVYNAWVQMDFKQADTSGNFKLNHYHQNYGYDLAAAFTKSAIKELHDPKITEDKAMMDSLKKGNLQAVLIEKNGASTKIYVEANPQFKTINVYDDNKQRLDSKQAKSEKQSQGESVSEKKGSRKESQSPSAEEAAEGSQEANKKKRRQSNSL